MSLVSSPTFLVYARPTRTKVPVKFLADQASAGATVPGFVYSLAKSTATQAAEIARTLPSATPVRLFPVDTDLLPHDRTPSRPVYDFTLTKNLPSIDQSASKAAGWLQAIVKTQFDLGASAIITPSLLLDVSHGETELIQMLDWASRARQTPGAAHADFLTGLILHREWVAKPARRELLLNHLTDRPDGGFYVVIRWAAPTKSDEQLSDRAALEGLKEVVEVLRGDDREIVIGRVGLGAWPLMALGASAASASAIPSHILRDPVKFARKKGSPSIPRIPLYLDRLLLSYVPFERMAALNTVSGIAHCPCSDCKALTNGYSDAPAFRHYLRTVTDLHDRTIADASSRRFALRQVKAARALVASNPSLALAARTTAHLPIWETLLT